MKHLGMAPRSVSFKVRTLFAIFYLLATCALAQDKTGVTTLSPPGEPLAGTEALQMEGDIAAQLVDGVDRFLLKKTRESLDQREKHWQRDFSSREAYEKSIQPNRKRLAHILGVRDERVKFEAPELVATTAQSALVGEGESYLVKRVRWPVFNEVHGEGLLLEPRRGKPLANIVAIPDADQTPEQIAGLAEGVPVPNQYARTLAEMGCRVIVPTLISRKMEKRNGRAEMTNREYIYRSAFELGRHLIGYEVQKSLAAVDWFEKDAGENAAPIGIVGYGEGGMLALYSATLDSRIEATYVAGYFDDRRRMWEDPIDRNVFGFLEQFGDAELSTMVFPRRLKIEVGSAPELELPSNGGAPGKLIPLSLLRANRELLRRSALLSPEVESWAPKHTVSELIPFSTESTTFCQGSSMRGFLNAWLGKELKEPSNSLPKGKVTAEEIEARQQRQLQELDRHNQWLLSESPYVRAEFMKNLDTSSLEAYKKTVEPYREIFAKEVIGQFADPLLEPKPRTRKAYEHEKWIGYEVVLDVFPDVIAYGILCVPKDLDTSGQERRPVVVCQHGLEGRPQDTIGEPGAQYYSSFAGKLAEQGYITFAPQNLYIGKDKFRTLQRKANPLGKTLFSVIVPQHQQIVNWLSTLPYVDQDKIAFYGLSYGGKSAMRIPPLVPNYCLSICSANFNEWVDKNASTRGPYSYVWTGEYEIFEFDLGSTFNYSEMAALICPRPFMVERGHFDGVGTDERVAFEYAKVQHLYAARLKIPELCEIEWFDGPHKINGVGTFKFLDKHLGWKKP